MRVLVAYGSKRGGTEGLADMIGAAFTAAGVEAVVEPARTAPPVDGFDAVVIAGALYAMRWHRDARRFVRRRVGELEQVPVWFVSSGPLDETAEKRDIPEVRQVASLMARVHARGHVTFGGRLEPDARGFPASAMAKRVSGDWRDRAHVDAWVATVVAELQRMAPAV